MTATAASFLRSANDNFGETSGIQVGAGTDNFKATGCAFNWDLLSLAAGSVLSAGDVTTNTFNTELLIPIVDVPLLTNNVLFNDVDILSGTMAATTLALTPLGSLSTNQRYVFTGNLLIPQGATLNVADSVNVQITSGTTITINAGGSLTFGADQVVAQQNGSTTFGIVVNGALTTVGTDFTTTGGFSSSTIQIGSTGYVSPVNSTFDWSGFSFGPGALFANLSNASTFINASSVNLAGSALVVNVGAVAVNQSFTIATINGTNPSAVVGTFNGLPNSTSTFMVGGVTFRINYAGGDGNDIVLTVVSKISEPPLALTGTPVLNGGISYVNSTLAPKQHSMVESVVYSFNQNVGLTAANFTLFGINGTVASPAFGVAAGNHTGSDSVWTVTFTGTGVNAGTNSIADGEYRLVLNGLPGMANYTYDFFRLLGDMDGDGTVSASDFSTLISTFLRLTSDPLYLGADDFDGDHTIGASDFSAFVSNYLRSVPKPLPPN